MTSTRPAETFTPERAALIYRMREEACSTREVMAQRMCWNGIPVEVTGTIKTHSCNWPLIDTEMDHRRVCATGAFGQTDGNPS